MPIKAGTQELFWTEKGVGEIAQILAQLEPYGLMDEREVPRTRQFVGMAYSIDKPVNVDSFMVAQEQNTNVLTQFSADLRKHSANAHRSILEKAARDVGATVSDFQQTIIQDTTKGEKLVAPPISETIQFPTTRVA